MGIAGREDGGVREGGFRKQRLELVCRLKRTLCKFGAPGEAEGLTFFRFLWDAGGRLLSGECRVFGRAEEMVSSEKKRCENHLGVNEEGRSRFKKFTVWYCFQVAYRQGFRDQETEPQPPGQSLGP